MSASFDIALSSADLLGVGRQGGLYSCKFTPAIWCGWILPIEFILFYKVYSKKLGLLKKNEDSNPFLRVPLSIFDVRCFPEEALKFLTNSLSVSLPRELLSFFLPPDPPIILLVSDLVYGLLFSSALVWRFSLGYCSPQKVSCFLGDPKFSERLLCFCERCPGKSSP